jgi:hypothetical protein
MATSRHGDAVRARDDLVRRVLLAFDVTERAVRAAVHPSRPIKPGDLAQTSGRGLQDSRSEVLPLVLTKVVGEAALLLRCTDSVRHLDQRLDAAIDRLASLVIPYARGADVLAALCLEPGLALDHAFAHVLLRDVGYPDQPFDELVAASLAGDCRPERPPTRELEQCWLHRIWSASAPTGYDEPALWANSSLSRPLDVLAASTLDIYSFTHLVLYSSDLGRRSAALPRPLPDVVADARAALAASLDADNFDLTAELLWTWPMLGVRWDPVAVFAFAVLAEVQDEHGFLPGPGYSTAAHDALPDADKPDYVLQTSYHTTLVMGMLCAAALRPRRTALAAAARVGRSAAANAIYASAGRPDVPPQWHAAFNQLDDERRGGLAGLVLTTALRRARTARDPAAVREVLAVALAHGAAHGPTVRQAVGLLRRAGLVAQLSPAARWSATTTSNCRSIGSHGTESNSSDDSQHSRSWSSSGTGSTSPKTAP